MFLDELNIDVQIYQEEVKKPNTASVVLLPLQNKSEVTNQLLLKWSDREGNLTQKDIDDASQVVFKEWERIFPLYNIERAFVDISSRGTVEVYVTFDASNIFSNTQIRNIKKTISDLFLKELKNSVNNTTAEPMERRSSHVESKHIDNQASLAQQKLSDAEKTHRRVELDLRERFNTLKKENSDLQMALQQSKADELNQKETIGHLTLQIERQQRTLNELSEGKDSRDAEAEERYRHLQEQLDDLNYKLRQSSQELLEKQREIQQLQNVVSDNDRYVTSLQADYDQLRESNNSQVEQLLQENDLLKSDLITYQNNELNDKQQVQAVKNEIRQINLEKENIQEELTQKLQRIEYENNELRTVLKENQVFEDKTQQDLVQTTRDLNTTREKLKQLETENSLLTHEWESRFQKVSIEKDELATAYNTSRQLEMERQNELIQLKDRLMTLEQNLQQAGLEQQRVVTKWESRVADEQREKDRIVQQANIEKEQFTRNKEQEIQRLSERLEQQQQLVDKLMATNTETQTSWQENYQLLETNYKNAREKSSQLEQEISRLVQENQRLEQRLAGMENRKATMIPTPVITPVVEEVAAPSLEEIIQTPLVSIDPVQQEIDNEVASLEKPESKRKTKPVPEIEDIAYEEESYYSYEDDSEDDYDYDEEYEDDYGYDDDYEDDYDYDYDYEDEYDDDDDYDYSEVDDLIGYDPETVREDVEELLDSADEEGTEKVSKKDFAVYEEHLDKLKRRLDKTEDIEFKTFVTPKMKKFNKFKNKFEEDVVAPKLFSRKYKIEEGTLNQLKAYVLMSRHLEVLAGEDDDDYDYGYEDDYDYDYDYD
ncbi:hypothetical protein P7H62_12765 [Vagococcus carniphilus]|uniref:Uncharacterized protein n=1 Tax=Vagococcus carniphilus TaxID=218144 RepID=A0AAW8UAV9_9ENTE|nr:hypothetical protein [Vagococcus carniphilus]MDT2831821.1 hypothetical protein [Vagococcus carniphilus]MDT2834098.1 hypothetical protein [Vagococcus carniphilus]MDT2840674.1 hypothetical protein [Vagococcus carniphilus]MDT2855331.1 hypothetical protein [Vagococcus carniphilus]